MRIQNLEIKPQSRENSANSVFEAIQRSEIFAGSDKIAIFSSLPDEIPTHRFIKEWSKFKTILLPRIESEGVMNIYKYNEATIATGNYGILEPSNSEIVPASELDLIIVPGVAFTKRGERLGRGKGYYDRYLAQATCNAYKIGVCYSHQIVESLPTEQHDIIMDEIIAG